MKFKLLFLLIFITLNVNAQVYKWTDENGTTHFGDKVPDKYKKEANDINVQPNVVKTVKSPEFKAYSPPKRKPKNKVLMYGQSNKKMDTSCSAKWDRYNRSKACFDRCGSDITNFYGGVVGRNNGGCSCGDVKKPKCPL
jgi:hypothetical protein